MKMYWLVRPTYFSHDEKSPLECEPERAIILLLAIERPQRYCCGSSEEEANQRLAFRFCKEKARIPLKLTSSSARIVTVPDCIAQGTARK
jgi:hypothetical protein